MEDDLLSFNTFFRYGICWIWSLINFSPYAASCWVIFPCTMTEFRYDSNLFHKSDHSAASLLVYNGGTYTAEPGLVTKKGEPPRTFLHLFFHPLKPPTLFFSSMPSEMRSAIFECLAMPQCAPISKCAPMSEWQFNSTLAIFLLLANYQSVKLTSEKAIKSAKTMTKYREYLTLTQNLPQAFFNLSRAVQTVEILLDDIALLNKLLQ